AVFSVTTDSFIVYFSNIFAIMGLRSLFFLLDGMKDKFYLLSYGLGCLLIFIGLKMILGICLPGFHIGTTVSLCVILGILLFSIVFSLIFPKKQQQ
ncbi:MAG: TerC family protein, partial [Bacteroidales bacterium]|nr:TerC family protein [Bacteroidales bacterium]